MNSSFVDKTASGIISGHVTGHDGTTPLENIQVSIYLRNGSDDEFDRGFELVDSELLDNVSAKTDADGNYSIGGLAAGIYHVKFKDLSGYYGVKYWKATLKSFFATDINVAAGQTVTNIDVSFSLPCKSSIQGRITGADGNTALQDIEVIAVLRSIVISSSYSDAQGNYNIDGLEAGTYQVEFHDKSGRYLTEYYSKQSSLNLADMINVNVEETVICIDALLALAGQIQGRVTGFDGVTPLKDIQVSIYRGNCSDLECDLICDWELVNNVFEKTDVNGNYSIGGLLAGIYEVKFKDLSGQYLTGYYKEHSSQSLIDDINITDGEIVTGIDTSLALAGHIQGRVTGSDGKTPVQGVIVYCYCAISYFGLFSCIESNFLNVQTETDANGNYNIGGLETESYRINFKDKYGRYLDLELSDDINVIAGETLTGIDVSLSLKSQIQGRVTGPDGMTPLENIDIRFYIWNSSKYSWNSSNYWEKNYFDVDDPTDADGNYSIYCPVPGTYRVEFIDNSGKYLKEYYKNQNNKDSIYKINVATEEIVTGIDVSLALAGHIRGRVTAINGITSLLGIQIRLYQYKKFETYSDIYASDIETDADGNYSIDGLVTGAYRVEFRDKSGRYVKGYYKRNHSSTAYQYDADIIDVIAGETVTGIDVSLAPACHIKGRVTGLDGITPLENICVDVDFYKDNNLFKSFHSIPIMVFTDADGNYTIGGLESGTYRVRFYDAEDNYLEGYYSKNKISVDSIDDADDINVAFGETITGINASLALADHIEDSVAIADGMTQPEDVSISVDSVDDADDIKVIDRQTVTETDASLELAGHIQGRVTGNDGITPLDDVSVGVYSWNGFEWERNWSTSSHTGINNDADGNYIIKNLVPGIYRVQFSDMSGKYYCKGYYKKDSCVDSLDDADDINVIAGETVTGIDTSLALAGHIQGRITLPDGRTPVQGVDIRAYKWNASKREWNFVWVYDGSGKRYATTDQDGNYIINGLVPGIYHLKSDSWPDHYSKGYYKNHSCVNSINDADNIHVAIGETVPSIDFSLVLAGHIQGKVTAPDGKTPLQGINVLVYSWDGSVSYWTDHKYTDAYGNYIIRGLFPGIYRVEFDDKSGKYLKEYYNNQSGSDWADDADDINVIAGKTITGIDASLALAGHIQGRVTGYNGVIPLKTVLVNTYNWDGYDWNWFSSAYIHGNGNYSIDGLVTGTYRVEFDDESGKYLKQYYKKQLNENLTDDADDINVIAGETIIGIDVSLVPTIPSSELTNSATTIHYKRKQMVEVYWRDEDDFDEYKHQNYDNDNYYAYIITIIIKIKLGGHVNLIFHKRLHKIIMIQAPSYLFSVSRSGKKVTFKEKQGKTTVIMLSKKITDSIKFDDLSTTLKIEGNKVMLGNQEITKKEVDVNPL